MMADIIRINGSQVDPRPLRKIPKGTVNAEPVVFKLDNSWDGLTISAYWRNVKSETEIRVTIKDPTQPHMIPWEVLEDLSELRVGLVGLDGGITVKPTVWLTYGYVVDGVDPDGGDDPQPPTPSWEQQMVEQATQANLAAQEAQQSAAAAAEALSSAGPYAEEAKEAAEAAKTSQDAAQTAAKEAENARDQATTAADTAQGNATAAEQAQTAAQQAAKEAQTAKEAAEAAAAILPAPAPEDAGKVPVVNPEGSGYEFGSVGGELLLAEYVHQGNQEIYFSSFDWSTATGETTQPHGFSEATNVFLIPTKTEDGSQIANIKDLPAEWVGYNGDIYLLPVNDTTLQVVGSDKITPIVVNSDASNNTQISIGKFHFETQVSFSITNLNAKPESLRIEILSFSQRGYYTIAINTNSGNFYISTPGFSPVNLYNNKSYHGYLYSASITLGLYSGMYSAWCSAGGVAKALSYTRSYGWAELSSGPLQLTNQDNKMIEVISRFSVISGGNTLHNGGVVRIYGEKVEE